MEREAIRSFDGKSVSLAIWKKTDKPKAILQILHGMSEHIARYNDFASFLNKKNIIVIGDDHRGHGQTDPDKLGLTGPGDIFEDTVKDELYITETFGKRFELPIVLLGHSYGSFLTQRYLTLQTGQAVKGYILSGSALMEGLQLNLGWMVAKQKFSRHKNDPGKFIVNQTFKKYDKKLKQGKNDWLSTDLAEVGKYNVDPLCGFVQSYGFYKYFFEGIKRSNKTPLTCPITTKMLIASGAEDNVGGKGKLVKKLYQKYKACGLSPDLKLYEGARHEILNERNRKEVYADFLEFINFCIKEH